jgi:hypothetical protein|tara:strand:+ start:2407 stop:2823 length:417 start_codon:yes stop_codon:yes gene_type:complete
MKNYVSLERAKSVDKDKLIERAFDKFNKQNVDKNGNYIKYSDLEQNFDGVTQMYEGLNELEDALIDYIEVIQTVKGVVKDKLKDGNFKTDEKVKDKLFYEVQDLQTFANQWLPDYSGNVIGGFNKLVGDIDEEHFHQL